MKELTDLNVEDLVFKNLPSNTEVIFVAHGDVFQYGTNFYINGIFKENKHLNPSYYITFLPLKVISAYPLGMIFKDQKLININKVSNIFETTLFLDKVIYAPISAKEIPELSDVLDKIPDTIGSYPGQRKYIKEQNVISLKDNNGMNIIFPVYEIARWFYFKSSSMTRQVLACSLEGLYKDVKYSDEEKMRGEIYLKYGSNNNDVAEIFRFAVDDFAKTCFESISVNLTQTIKNLKNHIDTDKMDKVQRAMRLFATFPVYGNIDFKIRGFNFGHNNFFVYQILEEDSQYPFNELIGYREVSPRKFVPFSKKKKKIPKKKIDIDDIDPQVGSETPNSENGDVNINSNGILIDNYKKDLENKKIDLKLIVDNDKESVIEKKKKDIGNIIDLSLNNSQFSGSDETAHVNIKNTEDLENEEKLKNLSRHCKKLELFKEMIAKCGIEYDNFNFVISNDMNAPSKPKNIKTKKKYLKAKLKDGKTFRKYVYSRITYDEKNYTIIEVEKDSLLDKLSTLIIANKDNSIITEGTIYSIIKSFIEDNGHWLKSYIPSNVLTNYLVHPDFNNKESLNNWSSRLIVKFT